MAEGPDYSLVTEVTGYNVTAEQVQRMYSRYRFASEFCQGKDVLEVACGSGQGLGYLATSARSVTGGDYDEKLVRYCQEYYKDRLEVRQVDAQDLPFKDKSFDVVVLFEALYYLKEPEKFIGEAVRVLRDGGTLIICSANKDWSGFNPSPHSYRYFSANELYTLVHQHGFNVEIYADCFVNEDAPVAKIIGVIKKIAVSLHLIPKTMKGKELLKRIFHGKLRPLPPEIKDGMAEYTRPKVIPKDSPCSTAKVIFAVGHIGSRVS